MTSPLRRPHQGTDDAGDSARHTGGGEFDWADRLGYDRALLKPYPSDARYLTQPRTLNMSGSMETSRALAGLSALAQESRLKVFRLLVRRGPEGMAAGDIARNLKLQHNTLSSHLGILSRASLVKSRKESRSIIYAVDLEGTRELLSFLVEDCCRGKREICQPLIASALAECC